MESHQLLLRIFSFLKNTFDSPSIKIDKLVVRFEMQSTLQDLSSQVLWMLSVSHPAAFTRRASKELRKQIRD
jgi:hypothetical protein